MNLLMGELPEAVEIDGHEYRINTDFHACLRTILAFEDVELTMQEKSFILIENLYLEIPDNFEQAVELGLKFLNGGEKPADEEEEPDTRLYSFEHDGNFIYSAFQQTHGIDLEKVNLHWWKFLALFMDLGSETAFCSLVGFRKRVKSGTASKEELRLYRENRDLFDIPEPDTRTPEEKEKEDDFMRLLNSEKI